MVRARPTQAAARHLHLACPHPLFDGPEMHVQAAALFDDVPAARTLLVSGHHRLAEPAADSACEPGHPASDPPYNSADFVSVASRAVLEWTLRRGAARGGRACAEGAMWVQLHGKADASCRDSTVFVSAGVSNATGPGLYDGAGASGAARLAAALARHAPPEWTVDTPASQVGLGWLVGALLRSARQSAAC